MIPIKLSIQGLYSYQGLQEIDFQKLIGSSVFGIFGKVGSGKTSLLEAISFALYGETERLNSRDNRQYNMMNLKSKHLLIDFEFQAGPDQQLYRFVYEAKRHPKKHHEIGPGERRMFIREGNEWQPIGNEKEDVGKLSKQILGLDYENFKRTIIIPQNQFREFLELSPSDRTKMMNQLFKLDQYDLASRVNKLSKANDDQLAELRGLLSPLDTVTPEAIEQAKTNANVIQTVIAETTQKINQLEPAEQQLLHLQKQNNSLIWARNELDQWLTHEPQFRKIQQDINIYEQCRLLFQADFAVLDKLQSRHKELVDSTQRAQHQFDTLTNRLPALLATYNSAKDAYENRDSLQKQLDELDTVQQIRTLQGLIDQKSQGKSLVEKQLAQQNGVLDRHKADRKAYQLTVEYPLRQSLNLDHLYQIQNWHVAHKLLKKRANELMTEIETYEHTIGAIKHRKDEVLIGFPSEWTDYTLKTLPEQIAKAITYYETAQIGHEAAYQQALIKKELQQYAESLTDGSACPLCGSMHHPAIHGGGDVTTEVAKADTSLRKVRIRIKELVTLQLTIKGLETELRATLDNGKRLIQERGATIESLTAHQDKFVWNEFSSDDEDAVKQAITEEQVYQEKLTKANEAIRALDKLIDGAESKVTHLVKDVSNATGILSQQHDQLAKEVASLVHFSLSDVVQWNLIQIADLRDSLTQQYIQTKIDFDNANKGRSDAEKEQATLQEQVQQLSRQVVDVASDIATLENGINKNLTDNDLNQQQIEQILRSNLDVEQKKRSVKEFDDKLSGFQKLVADLEVELSSQSFDSDALLYIQGQLQTLRGQKDDLNKEFGQLTNVFVMLERQWTQKQEHQKRHDELDLRRQDLKKMDEMFRAQGFVNYVSAVYLKNLCESANERFFKLTNNQLKLELDDKNIFLVRDYLNSGEVRSVKTLSGGQMFQAALSLALALSDNIQHLTKAKQNLFFLDEGFGTLDKDSLQMVFKTLKALRSENRVVGIISHVEELQQEVDNFIRAEATENGSRIVRSWD
ncbi:AAA family ATPase [Spirosoma flavum]|uniref:AAA family ATPase n=1 Tax=Spirosoma flavum TaxID=2048557 RepID=A0ABW6AR51_9BACT